MLGRLRGRATWPKIHAFTYICFRHSFMHVLESYSGVSCKSTLGYHVIYVHRVRMYVWFAE
ncbi:hypothetical protein LINPERHAP2_LOCUS28949, partial [Linum perenne]